jgi:Ca-activated chloride channel homolog
MLWFLFSIPLLIFTHIYFLHHARRKAIRFGNFHTIERVTGKRLLTKNIFLLFIRLLTLTFLILAAAGVTLWQETRESTNTVVLVIDTSASMTTADMNGTRLEAAKTAAMQFIESTEQTTNIGVVQFSGLAQVVLTPTSSRDAAKAAVADIKIQTLGGTDIAGAITTGTNVLSTAQNGRVMILLTDGVSSFSLYEENPIPKSTLYARDHQVIIHTIGVGTQTNGAAAFIPALQEQAVSFDQQNLQQIANATGGTYSWAHSPEQLIEAYDGIIAEGSTAIIPLKLSYGFLFVALMLLFIEWGLANTRYRLLP